MRVTSRFSLAIVAISSLLITASSGLLACGGSAPPAKATPTGMPLAEKADAGAPAAAPPVQHPFAKNAAEVTSMIDDAIEAKRSDIMKCVEAARKRTGDPRGKVTFDLGIDQEGTLIGVKTPKGAKEDDVLNACVREALSRAAFPRSNAGVVTVKKIFSDELVYPK